MIKKVFITFFILISFNVFSKNKLSSQFKLSVEKYQLENGLTVLLNSDKTMKTASYILGYKVGGRHEKKGITGISHMFEHLMFRGTKKYPNLKESYAQEGVV
ncbi:MAG: insulinase family protein, partial [Bdellovibrionales bacterium]|nr:insulinase family protein [Bdellovibrionales bacterium]